MPTDRPLHAHDGGNERTHGGIRRNFIRTMARNHGFKTFDAAEKERLDFLAGALFFRVGVKDCRGASAAASAAAVEGGSGANKGEFVTHFARVSRIVLHSPRERQKRPSASPGFSLIGAGARALFTRRRCLPLFAKPAGILLLLLLASLLAVDTPARTINLVEEDARFEAYFVRRWQG